jgi:signal transduction histidine kinase
MLAVTKLNSKNIFIYNDTDVKPLIEQTVTIVKSKYPNQIFMLNCAENLPSIFVDRDKFQQIMTNLIENSAKYSLGASETIIDVKSKDDSVEIKVSNKGIGIEPKDYEKIFTKFARIDNPLTRKVQGSGLGLYITKSLTEKMGGCISVKSEPIENSDYSNITFTLLMPVKNIEEQARIKCSQ